MFEFCDSIRVWVFDVIESDFTMFKRSPIYVMFVFLMGIMTVTAQINSCPALVEEALIAVGDNCANLDRNSACYGYNQVTATFLEEFPADYFSTPADRTSLVHLDSLVTASMDLANDRWGVAVMNIQANLPNTVPGQGVIMMLVGDAEVRNDVAPDDANEITDPISTATLQDTILYTSPSPTAEAIATIASNEIVLVDGFDSTLTRLRMVNDGVIGWVDSTHVARLAAMENLPIIGASRPSPMQAFYLSTGIGQSECTEADSMIAVQSPENITVDLTVNGVDIRVGSLVTFKNLDQNIINLTVHRGGVTTVFGNTISAGQSAFGVVNPDPTQGGTIIAWGDPVPASQNDLILGQTAQNGINQVAQNNGWVERSVEGASSESTPPQSSETESGEIIHIVAAGETLFGIGRQYDASLPAIVARNGLSDPYTVYVGQSLVIPNPGSGFVGLPNSSQPVSQPSTDTESDTPSSSTCDTLRLVSPLGTVPAESVPYYWEGVSGATQYLVQIFDSATGLLMGQVYTNGAETTVNISAGELSVGGGMQWQVIALQNGQEICNTGLSQPLTHLAPVTYEEEEPDISGFSISWECSSYNTMKVSWSGALDNDTIDFDITDQYGFSSSASKRGASGSFTRDTMGYVIDKVVAKTSSGAKASLKGSLDCF